MTITDEQYQATLYALANACLSRALARLLHLRDLLNDDGPAPAAAFAAGAEAEIEAAREILQATRLSPTADAEPASRAARRASGSPATGSTP